MFNKKLKLELQEYKQALFKRDEAIISLQKESREKDAKIKLLEDFNKTIEAKIKEIAEPKVNNFCLSMVGSGIVISSDTFNSKINILNKSYDDLGQLLESQAKEIIYLKQRDEENQKLLLLAAKVEQLINKINK